LLHLPRRYEDRGCVVSVRRALSGGGPALLRGRVAVESARYVRRRLHIADGYVEDDTGRLAIRWFNQPWIAGRLESGVEAFVFGSIGADRRGREQMVNPELEICGPSTEMSSVVPIYTKLGSLGGKRLKHAVAQALDDLDELDDPLPRGLRDELGLPALDVALLALHRPALPDHPDERRAAVAALDGRFSPGHRRLALDELLAVAAVVTDARSRRLGQRSKPIVPRRSPLAWAAEAFDFSLTGAQRRAIAEIAADMAATTPMARLLQGDVGSGKTAVAAAAVFAAVDGGRQVAFMAPTELLAEQVHRTLLAALAENAATVALLTGSLKSAEASTIRRALSDGSIDVAVGTHALFQETVAFADLGLVVIDEQHRFGVAQRQRLLAKGGTPHLLVMTATPIPRSLALTLYGDLDLTLVDELPPGRVPVRTEIRRSAARGRVLDFVRREIADGGQAYIVCPLIEPSPSWPAVSLEEIEPVVRAALPEVPVAVLHGRMDREQRERIAKLFREGEIKALLATTVIEVGVDVPRASIMIIEGADRFGLSQLHQLRGRVGRGARQSWCVLVTDDEPSECGSTRLEVIASTNDGFEIADADLRHRGPGELTGLRQWGAESFRFANLADIDTLRQAYRIARRLAAEGRLDEVREGLAAMHPVGGFFAVG
jgi:ATP-dependent DNA helicase RecG